MRSQRPIEKRLKAESGRGSRQATAKQSGKIWFGLLGYQLKEGQEKTISQSLPCRNCPEECFTMEKCNGQF